MKVRDFSAPDTRPLLVKAADYRNSREDNYMPPITLGRPKASSKEAKRVMAMDASIKNVLSGIQDELSYMAMPKFLGYAMLSNISQEALIRAGVETIADEMTRKFVEFTYDDDDGNEAEKKEKLITDMESQAAKYKLKETFNDALIKDGNFGGCLIYIDVGDLDDEEAAEPLVLKKETFKKGSFRGFRVIEPINIYPGSYNTSDPTSEDYFKPEYWYILGRRYHASRFIYIASNEAPLLLKPAYNFFGIPRAQLALDYVAQFVANRESAQELLNKFSLTCWKTNMGQELQGKSLGDLTNRAKLFNKMKHNSGVMLLDKETEDMVQINTPLGGVREIVEMSLNLLTAVWRIPKIKYLGEGEGGLNASSVEQMRSFYDFILSQKEKVLTQPMETVLKIFQLNLGYDINDALGFKFPSLVEMDESERANLNKMQADRDNIYLAAGVISQEEVRQRLSMDKNSGYSMIDIDDVPEMPEEPLKDAEKVDSDEEDRVAADEEIKDIEDSTNKTFVMDEFIESEHPRDKEGRFIDRVKGFFKNKKAGFKLSSKNSTQKKEIHPEDLKNIRAAIGNLSNEVFIGYNSKGEKVGFGRGEENKVGIPKDMIPKLKGGILIHNHPNGGPFSSGDLKMIAYNKIPEIIVVSRGGKVYHLVVNDFNKIDKLADEVKLHQPIFEKRNSDLAEEFIKHGKINQEDFYDRAWGDTIKDFEKFYKNNEDKYDYKLIIYE